jgi:hypothetical protein
VHRRSVSALSSIYRRWPGPPTTAISQDFRARARYIWRGAVHRVEQAKRPSRSYSYRLATGNSPRIPDRCGGDVVPTRQRHSDARQSRRDGRWRACSLHLYSGPHLTADSGPIDNTDPCHGRYGGRDIYDETVRLHVEFIVNRFSTRCNTPSSPVFSMRPSRGVEGEWGPVRVACSPVYRRASSPVKSSVRLRADGADLISADPLESTTCKGSLDNRPKDTPGGRADSLGRYSWTGVPRTCPGPLRISDTPPSSVNWSRRPFSADPPGPYLVHVTGRRGVRFSRVTASVARH